MKNILYLLLLLVGLGANAQAPVPQLSPYRTPSPKTLHYTVVDESIRALKGLGIPYTPSTTPVIWQLDSVGSNFQMLSNGNIAVSKGSGTGFFTFTQGVTGNQTLSVGNAGALTISGGNTVNSYSLIPTASTNANNLYSSNGIYVVSNTTGSTNYPLATGGGIRYLRTASSALGYFEFWKSSLATDELYFRTGSGTSTYNNFDIIAGRTWVAGQLSGYVPNARTITINGTTLDLSANRSWTIAAPDTSVYRTVANSNGLAQLQTRFNAKSNLAGGNTFDNNLQTFGTTGTGRSYLSNTGLVVGSTSDTKASIVDANGLSYRSATGTSISLRFPVSTVNRVINFQDKDYTIAGLDDITNAIGAYVTLGTSQTITAIKTFSEGAVFNATGFNNAINASVTGGIKAVNASSTTGSAIYGEATTGVAGQFVNASTGSGATISINNNSTGLLANFSSSGSPKITFSNNGGITAVVNNGGVNDVARNSDVGKKQVLTASGNGSATTISIAHGMSGVTSASWVSAIANNAASSGIQYVTVDATNINIIYTVAPASGTNNLLYSIEIKP